MGPSVAAAGGSVMTDLPAKGEIAVDYLRADGCTAAEDGAALGSA
jgi:hypothetical protein